MTKTRLIARLVTSFVAFLAAMGLLISLIYIFSDYETNTQINAYLDEFNIPFIVMMCLLFFLISFLLAYPTIKKIKKLIFHISKFQIFKNRVFMRKSAWKIEKNLLVSIFMSFLLRSSIDNTFWGS